MNAISYAEICRVGNLEADFSISFACLILLKFLQYCCETQIIQIQERKVKIFYSTKIKKKITLTLEIA